MTSSMGFPIKLTTERFELRTLTRSSDPTAFQRWTSDPSMMSPLNLPARVLSCQQVAEYWAAFDMVSRFFFGIFDKHTTDQIGFWMIESDALHRVGTLHLLIEKSAQRRLVVQESALVLFDWLFDVAKLEKLLTFTLPHNTAVIALMREGGWTREAVLREEVRSLTGPGRLDQVRYGLLPKEWRAIRAERADFVARIKASRRPTSNTALKPIAASL